MTKKDIEYFKDNYFIGTKIECIEGWTNFRDSRETGVIKNFPINIELNENSIWVFGSWYTLCVYNSKKKSWAKIISQPNEVIREKELNKVRKIIYEK